MIRKDKTEFFETINGIELFEEEINYIISLLQRDFLTIEIEDENNSYSDMHEVKVNKGIHPKNLKIFAREKGAFNSISIEFKENKVIIFCHGKEVYSLGLEIKDYLKNKRHWYLRIFKYQNLGFFLIGSSWMIKIAFDEKNLVYRYWILGIWTFFLLIFLISVFIHFTINGLNLSKRHEYGFWKRNKDKIIIVIITAIITILGTLFVQWVMRT